MLNPVPAETSTCRIATVTGSPWVSLGAVLVVLLLALLLGIVVKAYWDKRLWRKELANVVGERDSLQKEVQAMQAAEKHRGNRDPDVVYFTKNGGRAHLARSCSTLYKSKEVSTKLICRVCAKETRGVPGATEEEAAVIRGRCSRVRLYEEWGWMTWDEYPEHYECAFVTDGRLRELTREVACRPPLEHTAGEIEEDAPAFSPTLANMAHTISSC